MFTQFYAKILRITQICLRMHYANFPCLRNYITQINYAIITHSSRRILRRSYTNKVHRIYAKLRRDYAKVFTRELRIITHTLRRNYANKLRTLRKYYEKVTQIIYAIITQCLRNVYAKLRKDFYAQYAIITQIMMCLRKHYAHFPCLRNYITQILRK